MLGFLTAPYVFRMRGGQRERSTHPGEEPRDGQWSPTLGWGVGGLSDKRPSHFPHNSISSLDFVDLCAAFFVLFVFLNNDRNIREFVISSNNGEVFQSSNSWAERQ